MKIFVIMPFSGKNKKHNKKYWDYFYEEISTVIRENSDNIKKMFNASDFEIYRASAPQGNIIGSILKDLKESYIVIGILTDHNPNVFYELGIRHAISKRTIMLCQESQKIPFDLYNYGVALYRDDKYRYKRIEKELLERLAQIASNPDNPDNPYFDFIINEQSLVKLEESQIKLNIIDQIEGEPSPHPPMFYREAERTGGEVNYKNRTFFSLVMELINYSTNNISIMNTMLGGHISSQHFSTDKLHYKSSVETAKATVVIRPNYKNKLNLEPGKIYQHRTVFVLDQLVPKEVSEITGSVRITDILNNKYSSSEAKFIPYCQD